MALCFNLALRSLRLAIPRSTVAFRCTHATPTTTREQQMVARALTNLRAAADAGNSRALYDLGMLHHDGEVEEVPVDRLKALEYFQRAADQMYPMGMYMLGRYLEEGEYIARDVPRAVSLIQQAANDGFYDAQKRLAYFYEYGIGVPKDINKAFALHRLTRALDRHHGVTDNSENIDLGNVAEILADLTQQELVEGATEDDELDIDTSSLDEDSAQMPWAGQSVYLPPSAQYAMMTREEWCDFVISGGGSVAEDDRSVDITLIANTDDVQSHRGENEPGKTFMNETELVEMAREAVQKWLAANGLIGQDANIAP